MSKSFIPAPGHTRAWWKSGLYYQIYPSSFYDSNGDGLGDIPGITMKLDYMKDLGVDVLWVSPFFKSPQYDMGYDISDYQDIHAPYGTKQDVDLLISGCKSRGMRIIFDLVVNHTSHEHPWFINSISSPTSPKRDWYIWRKPIAHVPSSQLAKYMDSLINPESGYDPEYVCAEGERVVPVPPCNWRAAFTGGSVWEFDEASGEFYLHFFCPQQPDLNWENPEVRQAIYNDVVKYWLDKGIDGFRIDTANMYSKHLSFPMLPITEPSTTWQRSEHLWTNGPRLHEFLQEMHGETFARYDCMTVGELPATPDVKDVLAMVSQEARMFSMVFQFEIVTLDFGKEWRHLSQPWRLSDFKKYLNTFQTMIIGNDGWTTNFLENHDSARSISRFCSDEPQYRQTAAKMLAIFLMTCSGSTYLYQGQEIGTANAPLSTYPIENYLDLDTIGFLAEQRRVSNDDPAVMAAAAKGAQVNARDQCRIPVSWSNEPQGGFTTAEESWMKVNPLYPEINVASQINDPESVLSFYKKLGKWRKQEEDLLIYGDFKLLDPGNEKTIVYIKTDEASGRRAVVVLNFTKERLAFVLPEEVGGKEVRRAMGNLEGGEECWLEAFEGRVYFVDA